MKSIFAFAAAAVAPSETTTPLEVPGNAILGSKMALHVTQKMLDLTPIPLWARSIAIDVAKMRLDVPSNRSDFQENSFYVTARRATVGSMGFTVPKSAVLGSQGRIVETSSTKDGWPIRFAGTQSAIAVRATRVSGPGDALVGPLGGFAGSAGAALGPAAVARVRKTGNCASGPEIQQGVRRVE